MGGARTQSRPASNVASAPARVKADRRVNSLSLYWRLTCAFFLKPRRHRRDLRADAAAFADHPHSEQTEGYINDALRRAGALTLSLVAHEDGRQVGHAAFSPVTIGDGSADWYGLGPVAVLPGMQGRGVGAALIREGLARLRALGAAGCVVMGIRRTTAASASRRDRTCATRACRPSTSWPWYTRPASGDVAYHEVRARAPQQGGAA